MSRHFISYSSADGQEFALRLRDELEAGEPSIQVWLDRRDIQTGQDWDTEIVRALQACPSPFKLTFSNSPAGAFLFDRFA